jgi:phage shock protein C
MSEQKRLLRSRTNRMLGGVCAGLANYLGMDPLLIRVAFAALGFVNGFGVILYFVLWIIIPDEASRELASEDAVRANLSDMRHQLLSTVQSIGATRGSMLVGLFLIATGAWFLAKIVFPDLNVALFWPLIFIGAGLFLLLRRR